MHDVVVGRISTGWCMHPSREFFPGRRHRVFDARTSPVGWVPVYDDNIGRAWDAPALEFQRASHWFAHGASRDYNHSVVLCYQYWVRSIINTRLFIISISISISIAIYHSIYRSFYLSIVLSIYLSFYRSIYLSLYQSIYLSLYQSIYLSIYLSLSITLSIYLSIYLTIDQSFYLSMNRSIYPLIYLSIDLFPHLSISIWISISIFLIYSSFSPVVFCPC